MRCPNCGREMPEGAKFCGSCGSTLRPPQKNGRTVILAAVILAAAVVIAAVIGSVTILHMQKQKLEQQAKQEHAALIDSYVDREDDEEDSDAPSSVAEEEDDAEEAETPQKPTEQETAPSRVHTGYQDRLDRLNARYDAEEFNASNTENKLLSSEYLEEYDGLLNEIYQSLKSTLSSDRFSDIRAEERTWIAKRDAGVEDACADWVGGTGYGLVYSGTMISYTRERCQVLIDYLP